MQLQLDDLRRAWEARDPTLVQLIDTLASQPDPLPEVPIREGALTFELFLQTLRSWEFRRKSKEEQAHYRVETIKALEAATAEVPLPDRLRLHEIIYPLWQDNGPFARDCLLRIMRTIPLTFGPWRALKRIFKEAEARGDTEIFGALAARLDMAQAGWGPVAIGRGTLAYLLRRAWRFLRRLGTQLPACYADACVDFLVAYPDDTCWTRTWIANHVFYHATGQYNRSRFTFYQEPRDLLEHRAFADLWKRSPRPLFTLLERAKAEKVRQFAVAALKKDFRALLRDVEPAWVARLVRAGSETIDEFVVWILTNVPRFEQAAFRQLGLHDAVLLLFDSPSGAARDYAAEYARTHARDLTIEVLIRLANNDREAVYKLALDLLGSRDPRKDVGLDAWGRLLETEHGHKLAADVLKKSFGPRELTPEWFRDRLFSLNRNAYAFARSTLPQVHPFQKLGPGFFCDLIDRIDDPNSQAAYNVAEFAMGELTRFDPNTLDVDFLKRALLNPRTSPRAIGWIDLGKLDPKTLQIDFWRALAYHPMFEADPWITALRQSGKQWTRQIQYDEYTADQVLAWLADVRRFAPGDLSLDWLMQLVARSEPRYHGIAVDIIIRGFTPADFAPKQPAAAPAAAAPSKVDLGGKSFLFTGKLATMQRKEAEDKVRTANGTNAGSVTNKLHYLVIGDEGSPLYGQGKKGSKQVKAEELNVAGGNIRIISERAFLQMLAGTTVTHSADDTQAGCERLWQMVLAPGSAEAPAAQLAMRYIRRHHPDICLAETDRPVDPGAEVPATFLTFERVKPLFAESRKPLREFALDLAKWEFARWNPPAEELIRMCEVPYGEVRKFVADALLAEDSPEHRRYRIDPSVLTPAAVYSFCESPDEGTRMLGMELINRSPRLRLPEELFRLTESPDRRVRAFVIRALWALYRDRGITEEWKPSAPPQTTVTAAARKAAAQAEAARGPGAPKRPEQLPASHEGLAQFLRRILFEIPPGRPEKAKVEEGEGITIRLKPLPARRAKLSLVEVMRDLALEDSAFARGVLPLLEEFMVSRGKSERDACLVAVTRIRAAHATAENLPATGVS